MEIVNDLFQQLHSRFQITQYDYSRNWLKKGRGYFAHLQSSKTKPKADVLLAILGEAMKQKAVWESSAKHTDGASRTYHQQQADYFGEIQRSAE
jgi:hypothetical protein